MSKDRNLLREVFMHAHETTDCILSLDQVGVSKQTRKKNFSYRSSVNKEMSIKVQLIKTIAQHRG